MDENPSQSASNITSSLKEDQLKVAAKDENQVQNDQYKEQNKTANQILSRVMSNPLVYDNYLSSISTESDTEQNENMSSNCVNSNAKTISSDPRLNLSNGQWKTAPLFDCSDQTVDLHTAVQKRYSALCMPVNMTNKMPIQKTRQMSIGNGKINKNCLNKINIYGQKIHVGLGFPTKAPVIKNKKSKMIEMSEKSFNNLEDLIKKIKNENSALIVLLPNEEDNNEENASSHDDNDKGSDDFLKNNNINCLDKEDRVITGQDISRVTKEIDSTKKHFIEMETNILSDFTNIKTSIDKILEDRKEIQKQHRIWLETMKKKICKTKADTKNIENN